MEKLNVLRQHLDEIDFQIVKLLNERMKAADEIAKWKIEHHTSITDPIRETEVLEHVREAVEHPVLLDFINKIYMLIMECAKASQILKQSPTLPFQKIGIIGLGLMGGSIAKTLKAKVPSLRLSTLMSHFPDNQEALQSGLIDKSYSSMRELVENSELIILASPISTVIPIAEEVALATEGLNSNLLIMDLASVKSEIVKTFERLTNSCVEYVSTHPMAGSERSGWQNSSSSMFVNAPWIITSHQRNSQQGLNKISALIEFLGANPCFLDPYTHDRQTALISHLPSRISLNILNFVKQVDPRSLMIAGTGFKSMTRLAHCNPVLRSEIASFNRTHIEDYLDQWLNYVQKGENP